MFTLFLLLIYELSLFATATCVNVSFHVFSLSLPYFPTAADWCLAFLRHWVCVHCYLFYAYCSVFIAPLFFAHAAPTKHNMVKCDKFCSICKAGVLPGIEIHAEKLVLCSSHTHSSPSLWCKDVQLFNFRDWVFKLFNYNCTSFLLSKQVTTIMHWGVTDPTTMFLEWAWTWSYITWEKYWLLVYV